jgi:hypothetical protein
MRFGAHSKRLLSRGRRRRHGGEGARDGASAAVAVVDASRLITN